MAAELDEPPFLEFARRRDGMIYAMEGGLWLHRHVWFGKEMAHLVSTNLELLLVFGRRRGFPDERLQYKPLRDPRTGTRRDAWHWDLQGKFLPLPATALRLVRSGRRD
jgi:hypothetical protein